MAMEDYLKIGFDFIGAAILSATVLFTIRGKLKGHAPWACLLCAFLSFIFANVDKIDNFKASPNGFQAQMKQVQTVLDDTKATVESLRELATMVASLQVDMLASQGRWDPDLPHQDQQKEQLLDNLKNLGLTPKQLEKVETADSSWIMRDYAFGVLMPLSGSDHEKAAAYEKAFSEGRRPTPDECEELLNRFHIDDAEHKELLEDYRYYIQHQKHRRPDVWHNRLTWLVPQSSNAPVSH